MNCSIFHASVINEIIETMYCLIHLLQFFFVLFSGTAAYNIHGSTLHRAFAIPIQRSGYIPLSEEKANTLRTQLRHVRLLIIDEVKIMLI
jgi:hypothetical protein